MKKILFFASALAGLFLAASCQQESLEPEVSGNVVSYTIQVPGALSTKVIGENVSAVTELIYEVYRTEAVSAEDYSQQETKLYQKTATLTNGTATVDLELVNNQNFRVLFWAQVPETGIYDTDNLRNVTIKTILDANQEKYAAFAASDFIKYGDKLSGRKVTLVRPIAQLNIATSAESLVIGEGGSGATTVAISGSGVLVNGLSTTYNVASGEAGEDEVEFVYNTKEVNLSEPTVKVNSVDYTYLSMNYVGFAAQAGSTVSVEYSIVTENVGTIKNKIENVPVKSNHRTNIIGNLITSMSDYTVTLDAEWGETEYVGPEFVEQPAYDADTKTWTVTNADELAWVAASVNGTIGVQTKAGATTKNFKGETVLLANDIDLEGKLWTPIGTVLGQRRYDYLFAGTFDGNGKTIYNLKVNHADCAGLFGNMCTATVKDLTINGFDLKADHYAGAIVGWVEQGASEVLIENCKAINGNIQINVVEIEGGKHDLGDKAGAIVGFSHHGKYIDNEVENVIIEGYRDLGGIVGYGNNSVVTGNSIVDVTLVQNLTIDYKKDEEENGSTPTTVKDYVGREGGTCTIVGNTGEANIVTAIASGVYASKTETDAEENEVVTEYSIYAPEGLEWLSKQILTGDTFAGETIVLDADMDMSTLGETFWAIGYDPETKKVSTFEGTFDGCGHTIKNISQQNLSGAYKQSVGLFAKVNNATFKDFTVEDFTMAVYGAEAGVVATWATGECTFEDIQIKDGSVVAYNCETGGVLGWAESGKFTFKDIEVASDVTVFSLWDSYDTPVGGIIGGVGNSGGYSMEVTLENINVACKLDVYNDCCSNYQWGAYRRAGMLIGNIRKTQNVNETTYPNPAAENITCSNVVVTYGDWMNYHYCEFKSNGHGSYDDDFTWKNTRVESSDWGSDGIDTENCTHEFFESHNVCRPFDQLFGGGQGVYGLTEYPGVTVNYPAIEGPKFVENANELTDAIASGEDVVLPAPKYDGEGNITNGLNMGTTQLTIDKPVTIDLNGNNLTTANNWGGITLKNGASIKNGTINHTGNTAAIKAWNVESIENVTINVTPTDGKVKGGIVIQSGADSRIGTLKNVTISGTTNGIETYNCGWTDDTPAIDYMENVTIDATDTGILLSAHIGKAKNCSIKGAKYGINMHLKGEYKVGIELDSCTVTGAEAALWGHDEKGISNTNNCSLTLTYDAETVFNGPFIWDFEDECKSVVTLNALK